MQSTIAATNKQHSKGFYHYEHAHHHEVRPRATLGVTCVAYPPWRFYSVFFCISIIKYHHRIAYTSISIFYEFYVNLISVKRIFFIKVTVSIHLQPSLMKSIKGRTNPRVQTKISFFVIW